MLILIIALIFGVVGAVIASGRGRNAFGWFILCFLFPLIGLILLLLLPPLEGVLKESERKACPKCAEYVRKEALVCKHCSYSLEENA